MISRILRDANNCKDPGCQAILLAHANAVRRMIKELENTPSAKVSPTRTTTPAPRYDVGAYPNGRISIYYNGDEATVAVDAECPTGYSFIDPAYLADLFVDGVVSTPIDYSKGIPLCKILI